MLTYMKDYKVISMLNIIFEWDEWNSKMISFEKNYVDVSNDEKWKIDVTTTIRLTTLVKKNDKAREVWHEDIEYEIVNNKSSREKTMKKCRKKTMTNELKRARR